MAKPKSQQLTFTHLELQNWKNFTQVEVALRERVFLVGPNASGKSNFLDLFRFLRDLASPGGGFQEAISRRLGVGAIRSLAARRQPDVSIAVTVFNSEREILWKYELAFKQDPQRRPILCREWVTANGELLLQRPTAEDLEDPARLTQTHLEQVNVNKSFRALAEFFQSIQYLHIVPQLVREPERSIGRSGDPFGGDFLEQLAKTTEKTLKARLRRIVEALKIALPQLETLELSRDKRGVPHLRGKYAHWRPQGAWQTEEQFSDGTLRLLGLLWAIMEGTGPLLLEEPELSLHPEIVRHIPQMFARVHRKTGRQVIVSTHSSDLLHDEGLGLDEVLLLIPSEEGTVIKSASDFEQIKELLQSGLSLADAVLPHTQPPDAQQLTFFYDQ